MEKDTRVNRRLVENPGEMTLQESYAHCCHVVQRSRSSFSCPMRLLPRDKRRSMYALYAFLRHSDDLADADQSVDDRRVALAEWRFGFEQALLGNARHAIFPALVGGLVLSLGSLLTLSLSSHGAAAPGFRFHGTGFPVVTWMISWMVSKQISMFRR